DAAAGERRRHVLGPQFVGDLRPQRRIALAGLGDRDQRRGDQIAGLVVVAGRARAIAVLAVPRGPRRPALARAGAHVEGDLIVQAGVGERGVRTEHADRVTGVAPRGLVATLLVADLIEIIDQRGEEPDRRGGVARLAGRGPRDEARLQRPGPLRALVLRAIV